MMNTSERTSRIALVTGDMGGIGRGIALALAARDFDVVVADRQIDAARTDELRAQIPAPARVAFVEGDLARLDDHPCFVADAFEAFGRIDVLVNHAGVSILSLGDLLDVSPERYDLSYLQDR